jgi:hypothetical protein
MSSAVAAAASAAVAEYIAAEISGCRALAALAGLCERAGVTEELASVRGDVAAELLLGPLVAWEGSVDAIVARHAGAMAHQIANASRAYQVCLDALSSFDRVTGDMAPAHAVPAAGVAVTPTSGDTRAAAGSRTWSASESPLPPPDVAWGIVHLRRTLAADAIGKSRVLMALHSATPARYGGGTRSVGALPSVGTGSIAAAAAAAGTPRTPTAARSHPHEGAVVSGGDVGGWDEESESGSPTALPRCDGAEAFGRVVEGCVWGWGSAVRALHLATLAGVDVHSFRPLADTELWPRLGLAHPASGGGSQAGPPVVQPPSGAPASGLHLVTMDQLFDGLNSAVVTLDGPAGSLSPQLPFGAGGRTAMGQADGHGGDADADAAAAAAWGSAARWAWLASGQALADRVAGLL